MFTYRIIICTYMRKHECNTDQMVILNYHNLYFFIYIISNFYMTSLLTFDIAYMQLLKKIYIYW